jgi:hypothetical protein
VQGSCGDSQGATACCVIAVHKSGADSIEQSCAQARLARAAICSSRNPSGTPPREHVEPATAAG